MRGAAEKIGYFGGSFDPPHNGHRAVALAAAERFALDRVLLAPTGRQPLKPGPAAAGFVDRMGMVAAMCAGLQSEAACVFEASGLDAPHADGLPNFTIDALRRLRGLQPDAALFVIVGADAFRDLRRWREPDALLSVASWIVVSRSGVEGGGSGPLALDPGQGASVHYLNDVEVPISATEIRSLLAGGADCSALLPPEVVAYIGQHGVYRR